MKRLLALLLLALTALAAPPKGTEILWDRYGVPHIFAPNHPSLFYAYGYAQMEAHSELLLRLYAQARGQGAQFYGEKYLESDRWIRVNGVSARARQWATQQSPQFAPLLAAFADGLNAWAKEHPKSLSPAAKLSSPSKSKTFSPTVSVSSLTIGSSTAPASTSAPSERPSTSTAPTNGPSPPSRSASGHAMLMSNAHHHTCFEVQLTAPGVTSYGAVWVGFPVVRQCVTEVLGWTQTTNNPNGADLYRPKLQNGGYILDGKVRPFTVSRETLRILQKDGTIREVPLVIRQSEHGPLVVDTPNTAIAMRITGLDRPRLFEQFWQMGLARNMAQFQDAMRMRQLPIFNTAYADRDGHIMYVYNAAPPIRARGDFQFWSGVVPGDQSDLIWSGSKIVPYDELPRVIDPPNGWVQNSNDTPWTSTYPALLDSTKFPAYIASPTGITTRAQRGIRILSEAKKMTFEDVKAGKLSTRVETADQFVDDLIAAANRSESQPAKEAAAGPAFQAIGGYAVRSDERRPLHTPRGFADPAKAVKALESVAAEMQKQYGSLHVKWGDAVRLRRGALDLPANGAPSAMGAIRTVTFRNIVNGKAVIEHGDTFYAVVEFSTPPARRSAARLRQLVEGGLETHRRSTPPRLPQRDASRLARPKRHRSQSRKPQALEVSLRIFIRSAIVLHPTAYPSFQPLIQSPPDRGHGRKIFIFPLKSTT